MIEFRVFGSPLDIHDLARMAASEHLQCDLDDVRVEVGTIEPIAYTQAGDPVGWSASVEAWPDPAPLIAPALTQENLREYLDEVDARTWRTRAARMWANIIARVS